MTASPQIAGRQKSKSSSSPATPAVPSENPKKERHNQNQPVPNVKLKVVVRGLPPNLPETKFKEVTQEWINETTVDWSYYVPGKLYERGNKPNVRSRAYAKFRNIDALATFHRAFNGHTFTDSKGRSSRAMIEFAPFQKSVKGRIKPDARQGTIDTSPEYKEFLDSLAEPTSSEPVTLSVAEEPTTTPLIEYLRHQKAVKAEKERINKEKARLAKIAALQAKANEQSAKLRADKLAKTEGSQSKGVDTVKEGKQVGVPPSRGGGRGGRGGGGRSRDAPRGKPQAQKPQSSGKNRQVQNNATTVNEPAAPTAADTSNAGTVQNVKSPAQPPAIANDSPSEGGISGGSVEHPGRGGRGGGRGRGRSRPYGVYRPGGGRGGRRGGNSGGGNDTKAPTTAGDG